MNKLTRWSDAASCDAAKRNAAKPNAERLARQLVAGPATPEHLDKHGLNLDAVGPDLDQVEAIAGNVPKRIANVGDVTCQFRVQGLEDRVAKDRNVLRCFAIPGFITLAALLAGAYYAWDKYFKPEEKPREFVYEPVEASGFPSADVSAQDVLRYLPAGAEKAAYVDVRTAFGVWSAAMNPTGAANLSTRFTNPLRARAAFGARARKNDGAPMVSVPTSVRCRGTNGKGREKMPTRTASRNA